jgi:hypothetical protein
MIKKITLFIIVSLAAATASSQTDISLSERYHPDSYTKYDLELKTEGINISIFKVDQGEPHLNPVYFDVYFQCLKTKSYYKLKRNFADYESEQTYCDNEKPVVEKINDKSYLSLPLKLAEPETGCPDKVNRKEIFSVEQIKAYCEKN